MNMMNKCNYSCLWSSCCLCYLGITGWTTYNSWLVPSSFVGLLRVDLFCWTFQRKINRSELNWTDSIFTDQSETKTMYKKKSEYFRVDAVHHPHADIEFVVVGTPLPLLSRVNVLFLWLLLCVEYFSAHFCFKGWLKAHLFKPLPEKVDNVSSRRLLEIIKEQEQMIVSCFFNRQ